MPSPLTRVAALSGLALGLALGGCSSTPRGSHGTVTRGCEVFVNDAKVPTIEWRDHDVLEVTFGDHTIELHELDAFREVGWLSLADGDRTSLELGPVGAHDEIRDAWISWKGDAVQLGSPEETLRLPEAGHGAPPLRLTWNGKGWDKERP